MRLLSRLLKKALQLLVGIMASANSQRDVTVATEH